MSRLKSMGWTSRVVILLIATLSTVAFWGRHALADIYIFANGQTDNGYILVVPVVACYLAWLRRSRLQFIRYRPNLIGPLLVAAGLWGSRWGDESGVQFAWHAGVLLALFGVIYGATGWELLRQFAPAIIALVLLIPIPGMVRHALAGPAQDFSVVTAHGVLQMLGFDVIREGSVIVIGGEPVAVGEACNGMRMVFALALVVYAFVFSIPFSMSVRLLLIAVSPLVALVCNIVRIVPTSIAYGWLDATTAEQVHDIGGWLMLPLALVLLVGFVRLLRWLDLPVMSWRLASS